MSIRKFVLPKAWTKLSMRKFVTGRSYTYFVFVTKSFVISNLGKNFDMLIKRFVTSRPVIRNVAMAKEKLLISRWCVQNFVKHLIWNLLTVICFHKKPYFTCFTGLWKGLCILTKKQPLKNIPQKSCSESAQKTSAIDYNF